MCHLLCGSEVCRWLASEGGDLQPYFSPGRPAPGSDFMIKLDPLFLEPSLASFPTYILRFRVTYISYNIHT